ncbi:MAG TPA: hypothetical protein VNC50_13810 [Planctomycetia bacterium]|nr:hypothetical protein [Planctomycetia bacterium]
MSEGGVKVVRHLDCKDQVDESADPRMAAAIVENGKVSRPGVCNATECLLVHAGAAAELLPPIAAQLQAKGVELRGCERTGALVPDCKPATEADYGCEFLDLILAVKVTDDLDAALAHIARHGTGHTEAIVTRDYAAAQRFLAEVDAAVVEAGAGVDDDRGPCGLAELMSYKYQILGSGQIRS